MTRNTRTKPSPTPLNAYIRLVVIITLHNTGPSNLCRLDNFRLRHFQLGVENPIPETACNTKSILVIGKVVLEVVLLECAVPCRETDGRLEKKRTTTVIEYTYLRW